MSDIMGILLACYIFNAVFVSIFISNIDIKEKAVFWLVVFMYLIPGSIFIVAIIGGIANIIDFYKNLK
jgi:hypothetical protein